jgi:uncharacterized protein (TIRG00374 family)
MKKMRFNFLIGGGVGIFLFYLFLKNAEFSAVYRSLKEASYPLVAVSVVWMLFTYFIRSYRWKFFLAPIKKIRVVNSFIATVIGFTITTLIPGRIGEIVRPCVLGAKENISKVQAFATVVVERVFDIITVLILFSIYLMWAPPLTNLTPEAAAAMRILEKTSLIVLIGSVSLFIFFIVLQLKTHFFRNLIERITAKVKWKKLKFLLRHISSFMEGLAVIDYRKNLPLIVLYSFVMWFSIAFGYFIMLSAFHIRFPLINTFFILIVSAIGASIPTPGAVGSYHKALEIVLHTFLLLPLNLVVGMAILMHAICFFPVTILGIIFISHEGIKIGEFERLPQKEEVLLKDKP